MRRRRSSLDAAFALGYFVLAVAGAVLLPIETSYLAMGGLAVGFTTVGLAQLLVLGVLDRRGSWPELARATRSLVSAAARR